MSWWKSKIANRKSQIEEALEIANRKLEIANAEKALLLLVREPLRADQVGAAFANAGESLLYKAVIQTIEEEREVVAHRVRTAANPDERAVEAGAERALNQLREVLVKRVVDATRKAAS